MAASPEIFSAVRAAVEPLREILPSGTRLLYERIMFPDEVPVVNGCFLLVKAANGERTMFESLKYPLEISLRTEENSEELRGEVERWLTARYNEKVGAHYPLKSVTEEFSVITGKTTFVPDDVPMEWKYFKPLGASYTFEQLLP